MVGDSEKQLTVSEGNQATRHTVISCDELTVIFDLAFVPFKSFAVVSDFDIARLP